MDTPMSLMNDRLSTLCNHVGDMAREMSEMKADLATVRTDVVWLKKFFWVPVGAAITALVGAGVVVLFR